jgi:hypothetical protein
MKKSLLLTLAVSALGASQLMATTYDLYITGSTAFRANVHDACSKLYDSGSFVEKTGNAGTGGDSKTGNAAAQWTMTGTVSNNVSALGTNVLNIHALFTGSVQGIQTVEQSTKLLFLGTDGTTILTNTPTIAFSDVASSSTPYTASGNFSEEKVCVQPFVICKSLATTNVVNNVTWDQIRAGISSGRIPLSTWTGKAVDTNSFVYLVERTKDSGTRRTLLAESQFAYNSTVGVWIFDTTTNGFWKPSALSTVIVGANGNGNANLNWGSGYVGGGDIKTELAINQPNNQAIAILSIADAKGVAGANWSLVIPFNNTWPTAAGSGISGNTGTNDYSPVVLGQYPLWAYEVCVYPNVDPTSIAGDQNLTATLLGNKTTAGTILGVLDATTSGTPLVGSIENEIELSKPTGATAVRLSEMHASRTSVGGTITP